MWTSREIGIRTFGPRNTSEEFPNIGPLAVYVLPLTAIKLALPNPLVPTVRLTMQSATTPARSVGLWWILVPRLVSIPLEPQLTRTQDLVLTRGIFGTTAPTPRLLVRVVETKVA